MKNLLVKAPQGTRKGYPYYGRGAASQACSSIVGIPFTGTLGDAWG